MTRRKPRNLNEAEHELWRRVTDTAIPLQKAMPKRREEPVKHAPQPKAPFQPQPFRMGERAAPQSPLPNPPAPEPVVMDRKAFTRMKRGKMQPDAKIDLHGMTQAEAHPALVSTILNAHAAGKRLVLVITGKGKPRDDGGPIPVRTGVLRHNVPVWLRQPPLSQVVMQVSEASQGHGGSGALYVYLRRAR